MHEAMPQIQCRSCGHENAADSKYCGACGGALDLPPHLVACLRCGSVNPFTGSTCLWCHAGLPGPFRRKLRRWRGRVAIAASAVAVLAAFGAYAFLRDDTPRAAAAVVPAAPVPAEAPKADAPPVEAPKARAPAPAVARTPASSARRTESCADNLAALGLCGKTEPREPPRPEGCSEGAAALGLCEYKPTQGRE